MSAQPVGNRSVQLPDGHDASFSSRDAAHLDESLSSCRVLTRAEVPLLFNHKKCVRTLLFAHWYSRNLIRDEHDFDSNSTAIS